jgi:hypothetical protein
LAIHARGTEQLPLIVRQIEVKSFGKQIDNTNVSVICSMLNGTDDVHNIRVAAILGEDLFHNANKTMLSSRH